MYFHSVLFGFSRSLKYTDIQIGKRIRPNRYAGNRAFLRNACAMKAFFIRQILPPVLVQLSIIVVLVYFEAKDFVPYVSPDEAGGGFSGGIGAGAERDADMAVAGCGSSTLLAAYAQTVYKDSHAADCLVDGVSRIAVCSNGIVMADFSATAPLIDGKVATVD